MVQHLIPLTDNDRRVLADRKNQNFRFAVLKAILAIAALVPLVFVQTLYVLITLPFLSLVLGLTALGSFLQYMKAKTDLDEGQKHIITGPIEAQDVDVKRQTDNDGVESSASYTFWVKVRGQKLTVNEDLYYQLKKNDQVEAEVGPASGIVFRINKFSEIA